MIEVEVRGDLEYAIKQLKKKLAEDGVKRGIKRRGGPVRSRRLSLSQRRGGIRKISLATKSKQTISNTVPPPKRPSTEE
ncbi:MAG: small subunit ribosomal protein S21 [Desulforhopalus sp.]|jgi:small subunit ribosomal protein S21